MIIDGFEFAYILNPTKEQQLKAVEIDGNIISLIDYPDKEVQLKAVKQNPKSIKYIKYPAPEAQLLAVNIDADCVRYIEDPSEETQLVAINKCIENVRYIRHPTSRVQSEAIKQGSIYAAYLNNIDRHNQLLALYSNIYTVYLVKNNTFRYVDLDKITFKDDEKTCGYIEMFIEKYISVNKWIDNLKEKINESFPEDDFSDYVDEIYKKYWLEDITYK